MPSWMRSIAAASAALACAGCPSLDALECHGNVCGDASSPDGPSRDAASATVDASTIFCGASSCAASTSECCFDNAGTSCVPIDTCNGGSDIFCDDPSQCDGGTCWICIDADGFQGTSCNYQGDIVGNWHCDMTSALPLCHESAQCGDGAACTPLSVSGLDGGFFRACQP